MNLKDKIIALDIDGTITEDCTLPSIETCNQINRLIQQGYNIVLMTGRGYATIKQVYENCKMNTYCVVFNGSYVFNPTTNDVIKNNCFEANFFPLICSNAITFSPGRGVKPPVLENPVIECILSAAFPFQLSGSHQLTQCAFNRTDTQ